MIPQVHFLTVTTKPSVYCVGADAHSSAITALRTSAEDTGDVQVCLIPEPDNPSDPRAVSVRTLDGRVAAYISTVENAAYFHALEPIVLTGGIAIARARFTTDGTLALLIPQAADILTPYSIQILGGLPRVYDVVPGRYNQQWPTFLTPQGTVDSTRVPREPMPAPTPAAPAPVPAPTPAPVHVQVNLTRGYSGGPVMYPSKSLGVYWLLAVFLGYLGVHHFYMGRTGMGIFYLFTAGGFGIGWLIDMIFAPITFRK